MNLELSVIVPMYNEQDMIPLLLPRLRKALTHCACAYELIIVDDGSTDNTRKTLQTQLAEWPEMRVISLQQNAGHLTALYTGFRHCSGEYTITMDADLQDPPELIPLMLRKARQENLDVVYGVRTDRSNDNWFKRSTASGYYLLLRLLGNKHMPYNAADFRLLSQNAVAQVMSLPISERVLRLAVPKLQLPSGKIGYKRPPRAAGNSKYQLTAMLKLSWQSLIATRKSRQKQPTPTPAGTTKNHPMPTNGETAAKIAYDSALEN